MPKQLPVALLIYILLNKKRFIGFWKVLNEATIWTSVFLEYQKQGATTKKALFPIVLFTYHKPFAWMQKSHYMGRRVLTKDEKVSWFRQPLQRVWNSQEPSFRKQITPINTHMEWNDIIPYAPCLLVALSQTSSRRFEDFSTFWKVQCLHKRESSLKPFSLCLCSSSFLSVWGSVSRTDCGVSKAFSYFPMLYHSC